MAQVAQAKFEAQEDRLRDVVRQTMTLLRDFPKTTQADCSRRVAEIQKALLKYEMQHVRVWELQERRRRAEIAELEMEVKRCQEESEVEGTRTVELRQVLENERRRRKRYEGYEQAALEVNRKKTRTSSAEEIKAATAEISRLSRERHEVEVRIDRRNQRAQLLQGAVVELKEDLAEEQRHSDEILSSVPAKANSSPMEVIS